MQRSVRARTIGELIRAIDDRLRRLETKRNTVVGPYVLSTNAAGQLVARHATTGTVTVVASP